MPLGLGYLGLALVLLALLGAGHWHDRLARLKRNPLRWPLAAFVGWTLVVLLLAPHYAETPSNLFHGLRIAATIAITTVLSREETSWALRGFVAGALLELTALGLSRSIGLPDLAIWHYVVVMKGNKSINDALLFALFGAGAAVHALGRAAGARHRWPAIAASVALLLCVTSAVVVALPSRTSLVGVVVALAGACAHQWRARLGRVGAALAAICVVSLALGWQLPGVHKAFELGLRELAQARAGTVSEGSWVVRFHMYRETTAMMLERPWLGWGIGGWTQEWQRRAPPLLANYNMPHNDFLWMGAQAGIAGLLALASVFLTALSLAWRQCDARGRVAFVALLIMLVATSLNSAMRDAAIGLGLPYICLLLLQHARLGRPGEPYALNHHQTHVATAMRANPSTASSGR